MSVNIFVCLFILINLHLAISLRVYAIKRLNMFNTRNSLVQNKRYIVTYSHIDTITSVFSRTTTSTSMTTMSSLSSILANQDPLILNFQLPLNELFIQSCVLILFIGYLNWQTNKNTNEKFDEVNNKINGLDKMVEDSMKMTSAIDTKWNLSFGAIALSLALFTSFNSIFDTIKNISTLKEDKNSKQKIVEVNERELRDNSDIKLDPILINEMNQ